MQQGTLSASTFARHWSTCLFLSSSDPERGWLQRGHTCPSSCFRRFIFPIRAAQGKQKKTEKNNKLYFDIYLYLCIYMKVSRANACSLLPQAMVGIPSAAFKEEMLQFIWLRTYILSIFYQGHLITFYELPKLSPINQTHFANLLKKKGGGESNQELCHKGHGSFATLLEYLFLPKKGLTNITF